MTRSRLACLALVLLIGGCSTLPGEATRDRMRDYGTSLQFFFPLGYGEGSEMPKRLDDLDASILADLAKQDEWNRDFHYRRVDMDHYNLISMGPNGKLGDDDDIIMENGMFYAPEKIYSEHPIK